jgi:hypothetical protein
MPLTAAVPRYRNPYSDGLPARTCEKFFVDFRGATWQRSAASAVPRENE